MILLAFLAAMATPQPAELKLFRDWIIGCDNGRACHAVALMPEPWTEDTATMGVRRGPEPHAQTIISVEADPGTAASLAVGGRVFALRSTGGDEMGPHVAAGDVPAMIGALRSADHLEIKDRQGAVLGTVSLAGASAALLYMDEQQNRVGTVTALARPGSRSAADISPPPPLPQIRTPPIGNGFPITEARIATLRKEAGCQIGDVGGPDSFEAAAIDTAHMLVLLACGSGAYNVTMIPYVARQSGRSIEIELASFDVKPDWWEDGRPMLVNAAWDDETHQLVSFSKGRGIGDCGTGSDYGWDGERFRLVRQVEMTECRGSMDYITTWRAEMAER